MRTVRRDDVIERFRASLLDSAHAFQPADLARLVDVAVIAYSERRPLEREGVLKVRARRAIYPCPPDLECVITCHWGRAEKTERQPWDDNYPGHLPELSVSSTYMGTVLKLSPAPSADLIARIGEECHYTYGAVNRLDDAGSSLTDGAVQLVILRAQVEAMRELAQKAVTRPVQLRDGVSNAPRNGTPAAMYGYLLEEFERRCS